MKLPVAPRWVAPVLVVVFLLLTVWAAYNVSNEVAASRVAGPSSPGVPYDASGSYGYVAALSPNDLFNTTHVSGDNITLFVSITNWINVTIVDIVGLGAPGSVNLSDQFAVAVSTPAWSKTIERTTQQNASEGVTAVTLTDRYDLSVPGIERLTSSINSQLNYSSLTFAVSFASAVSGTISLGGEVAPLVLAPRLVLTFSGSVIVPQGVPAALAGTLGGSGGSGDPVSGTAMAGAYLELTGALVGLLVSFWLLWSGRRTEGPSRLRDLEELIEPYEEVIARTTQPPEPAKAIPVERWEDLVKVADTLGRPILRPPGPPSDPKGSDFYVFDGTTAYLYRYPRPDASRTPPGSAGAAPAGERRARPGSPGPPTATPKGPPKPPVVETGTRAPVAPPAPGPVPADAVRGTPTKAVAEQFEVELRRIRTARLDPAQRWYAFSLFTQTVRAVSAADPEASQRALDELRHALDRILLEPPRRS